MKTILFAAIAAIIAFAPQAQAQIGHAALPAAGNQVCYVYGNFKKASSRAEFGNTQQWKACGISTDINKYIGFRLEPMVGLSTTPISKFGICRFLSNTSNSSYFIPANSAENLKSFLNHLPAGVSAVPCTNSDGGVTEISVQDSCGVGVFSKPTFASYTGEKFNALNAAPVTTPVRTLYAVSPEGKLLRTLIAVPSANGWTVKPLTPCANAQETASATPAAFNRLDSAAGGNGGNTQRVFITDGALARNLR